MFRSLVNALAPKEYASGAKVAQGGIPARHCCGLKPRFVVRADSPLGRNRARNIVVARASRGQMARSRRCRDRWGFRPAGARRRPLGYLTECAMATFNRLLGCGRGVKNGTVSLLRRYSEFGRRNRFESQEALQAVQRPSNVTRSLSISKPCRTASALRCAPEWHTSRPRSRRSRCNGNERAAGRSARKSPRRHQERLAPKLVRDRAAVRGRDRPWRIQSPAAA